MKDLTKSEELILLSVIRQENEAYGVNIKEHLKQLTGKNIDYGTLYSTFEQLVNKGYLVKNFGESSPERGGKRKLYFKITESGLDMLKNSFRIQKSAWEGINEEILNGVIDAK